MTPFNNKTQMEEEIINFLLSRIKKFQRIDCEITLELIARKNNISTGCVEDIIRKHPRPIIKYL